MHSTVVAALVFGCTFAGALAGLALHARLPDHHLDANSRDVIKLVMGLIATVAALVLGLLISSASRSYDEQEAEVQQLGVRLFQLDRNLERFGPESTDARRRLRRLVLAQVGSVASPDGSSVEIAPPLKAQQEAGELFDAVAGLVPKTDGQRFVQTDALRLLMSLADTRLLLNEQAHASISWPFLIVLAFWLTVLFIGFGLFARRNATVIAALLVGAISVAGAIFLIMELNRPYGGVMQISIAPIRNALTQMSR